ncbi:MAG: endonuclease/exonuclease/phosphatase family protein [Deltaproteobacteria bacterium]|nr:endonuclease/exonuclease/phosphatase family protein [Deltaproteobacteria bacterium]
MTARKKSGSLFAVALTCLFLFGCDEASGDGTTCVQDRDCETGLACIEGTCRKPAALPLDGGAKDSGVARDVSGEDGAPSDAGPVDSGGGDEGVEAESDGGGDDWQDDAGVSPDADSPFDGGTDSGEPADAGTPPDIGTVDAGEADAGEADGGGADAGADGGGPAKFSVMTINLKHPLTGIDEAIKRLQIVATGINDKQPDVVALQEVVKSGSDPNLAEQLAGLTGYQWVWEFAYTVPALFDEGLGILSRWPVLWNDSAELPHLDLVLFQRRVLGGLVDSPHGQIHLFCTHMTTDSGETVKADQALAVYEFIQTRPSPLPGFLAGDMNAEPDKLAMRFYRGEAEHEGKSANFVDSWAVANPGDEGFTMSSSNPQKRIDYIYVVPGQAGTAAVVSCEIMFAQPVGGLYASDHLGVYCEFTLP